MGSTKSYHWLVRLTTDDVYDFPTLFGNTVFGAYVYEKGGKTAKSHVHLAISFVDCITRNQLNKLVTAFFDKTGNEYRSFKIWKSGDDLANDSFLQYMHKDGDPVMWGSRLGLRTPDEYRHMARSVAKAIKQHQTLLDDMLNEVASRVREKYSDYDLRPIGQLRQAVVDAYYDFHIVNKRKFKSIYHIGTDLVNIMAIIGTPASIDSIKSAMMMQLTKFDKDLY